MPIIKARTGQIDTVGHGSRLQKPNRDALLAYASFIADTPCYVLSGLIRATRTTERDCLALQADACLR